MILSRHKMKVLYNAGRAFDWPTAARVTANELRNRYIGPHTGGNPGLPDQKGLIKQAIDGGANTWLIWFDGGRFDWAKRLFPEYFDITQDDILPVWNGGVGYTGDWSVRNLTGDYPGMGLFSMAPVREFNTVDYDGRDHFAIAPNISMPDGSSMNERLAALGYMEKSEGPDSSVVEVKPRRVNNVARSHFDELRGGVVRYLKPHPPFEGLSKMTSGASKVADTMAALANGSLSIDEFEQAYVDTYRTALEAAAEFASDLDGRVILTADHGECLRCGQLYHSRRYRKHDHLCKVPWVEL